MPIQVGNATMMILSNEKAMHTICEKSQDPVMDRKFKLVTYIDGLYFFIITGQTIITDEKVDVQSFAKLVGDVFFFDYCVKDFWRFDQYIE